MDSEQVIWEINLFQAHWCIFFFHITFRSHQHFLIVSLFQYLENVRYEEDGYYHPAILWLKGSHILDKWSQSLSAVY